MITKKKLIQRKGFWIVISIIILLSLALFIFDLSSQINYYKEQMLNFCELSLLYQDIIFDLDPNIDLTKFDAIVSCSVIEHIVPAQNRIKAIKKLKELLEPHGKMMHIADFYFPEKIRKKDNRINFYELSKILNFSVEDLSMCPGAPDFDFKNVKQKINFVYSNKLAARIAVGDDLE